MLTNPAVGRALSTGMAAVPADIRTWRNVDSATDSLVAGLMISLMS